MKKIKMGIIIPVVFGEENQRKKLIESATGINCGVWEVAQLYNVLDLNYCV